MREENSRVIIRIVLAVFWTMCIALSLIYASNECKSLILTVFLILIGFLGTSEPNRALAVIQWIAGGGYVVYLFYIITISSCNFIVLVIISLIVLLIMARRIRNQTDKDWV